MEIEKNLKKLEFDKILEKLEEKAASEPGRRLCRALRPSAELYEIERGQQETEEAFRYLMVKNTPPLSGLLDVRDSIARSVRGGMLTTRELLDIARVIQKIRQMKDYGKWDRDEAVFEVLDPLFAALSPQDPLEKEIHRCILAEDEISDNASAHLSSLRREIHTQQEKVRTQLQSMIHSQSYKNVLQDPVVTLRSGRFCLPVRSECKASVKGMVHDQSSSGSTVFIEPMAVVQINNRITELYAEEEEEIRRILTELTARIAEKVNELTADFDILVQFDFIFAKGKLALEMNAIRPAFSEERTLVLPQARHPLLNPKTVVPITIRLGGSYTTLVITGPNTGGKTVTLKTLGLLCLMGQAGLHIPTSSQAKLCVMDPVFADIGDEQSIEQSLSTFSSHMVNIVEILNRVTDRSLVLFDELGAGTDPTEGAALAQCILENLRRSSILTAATTHYSELKIYALSTEGVENASCEFDIETLQPTYRLLIGVPGKSNAFAISKRLGLSDSIIQQAGELLESNDIKFEEMMSDLEVRRRQVEAEQERILTLRRQLAQLQQEAADAKEKLEEQREKILGRAKEEARTILRNAKADADHTIARMNKMIQKGEQIDIRAMEQERTRIREKAEALEETRSIQKQTEEKSVDPAKLSMGLQVRVRGFEQPYTVLSRPDARGMVTVQAGIMKMPVSVTDIVGIFSDKKPEKTKERTKDKERGTTAGSFGKAQTITMEVDLRGMTVDEALVTLDKYLDDAYLAGVPKVTVIHGKGTGALRQAVHRFLKRAPQAGPFRLGTFGEGDAGVTIVEMKKHS